MEPLVGNCLPQLVQLGGIHFLRRRPRGEGGSQISTLLNSLKLSTKGEGVKKVQNLVYVENG